MKKGPSRITSLYKNVLPLFNTKSGSHKGSSRVTHTHPLSNFFEYTMNNCFKEIFALLLPS